VTTALVLPDQVVAGLLPAVLDNDPAERAVAGLRRKHGARPATKAALVTAQLAVICTRLQERTRPHSPTPPCRPAPRPGPNARRPRSRCRHGRLGIPTDPDPHTLLTGQSVALLVKQAVSLLDDPARFPPGQYAGHSLRAGFATQAASAGVRSTGSCAKPRHASIAVALRYIREADIWKDNANAALGL
jgi:hypothetical protein